jgi:hypothetical protein
VGAWRLLGMEMRVSLLLSATDLEFLNQDMELDDFCGGRKGDFCSDWRLPTLELQDLKTALAMPPSRPG